MENFIQQLLAFIFTDAGNRGMLALMMLITCGFGWMLIKKDRENRADIKELVEQFQKQADDNRNDLMEIIEKYQSGQISVINAINEIRILLATIGAKF